MPRWIILLGYLEVVHFVVSKANQKKITVVLSLDWFHVIYSPESCTASPPPDSEANVRQGGQHNFVSPLFSHAFLFFSPLALSLPVLIALPHLCWFYLRWWLFDACASESHPYSVHRAVSAERRCSFFILSLCLSSSPSVLSGGLVTFNPESHSLISPPFSTAQGHGEAQLQRTAPAQDTAIKLWNKKCLL